MSLYGSFSRSWQQTAVMNYSAVTTTVNKEELAQVRLYTRDDVDLVV
ncbi:hypothetical protein ACFSFY_05200 [Sporosarcina siberiensis]|uniref:Uncharacterized protein n=1 Tax=Sporosarcina siberiensis TaxID=1365606 RepID=A0ABW4SFR3_9BACL